MATGTFATAINCMDGRVQLPVIAWMKQNYKVEYIDMLTEPGPDKLLAEQAVSDISGLQEKIDISIEHHGSKVLALAGHGDCAGNPVEKKQHLEHIKKGVKRLAKTVDDVTIVGLWIDTDWTVEKIAEEKVT